MGSLLKDVGPGGLRAPPGVADKNEAGNYFGPGVMRAPLVVPDGSEAGKLFWSRHLACTTSGGGRKRSWPLFYPTFFSYFLSTPSAFHPLRGYSRR